MKTYNVTCPKCNTENKNLYLYETEGWFICECCGRKTKIDGFDKGKKLPLYTGAQAAKVFARK